MQDQRPKIRIPAQRQNEARPPQGRGDLVRPEDETSNLRMNRTQTFLSKYYQPVRGSIQEDSRTGHRIYRLKGYTTIDKINRKFQQERHQRTLRNILTFIMIVILMIILFAIYNPFTNIDELKKITGENSYYKKQNETESEPFTLGFP